MTGHHPGSLRIPDPADATGTPLYRLPARTFLEGFYWCCDFTLAGGRILHDYPVSPAGGAGTVAMWH